MHSDYLLGNMDVEKIVQSYENSYDLNTCYLDLILKTDLIKCYPRLKVMIESQTNYFSQIVVYNALNSVLINNTKCLNDLIYYSNCPVTQIRVCRYHLIPTLSNSEELFIAMMNVESNFVEKKLYQAFKNGLITDYATFESYKQKYELLSMIFKKDKVEFSR